MVKVWAREVAGKVEIYTDKAGTRKAGAFPFDSIDRLSLKPHVTGEVVSHGCTWKIIWLPPL